MSTTDVEDALVVLGYEPYSVPKNWCWTYWGNCGSFVAGSAFKEKFQGNRNLNIPFYKVGSLKYSNNSGYLYDNDNTIDEEIRKKLKASLIPENSIIFAKIGEAIRLNRRSLNSSPCCIDNNLMAFISNDKCYYKYVFYWSKSVDLYAYTNATTVPAIRKTDLEKIPFPLAPYNKQVEIVEHIESLFSKLDNAKENAQEVLDNFENRKASILHKAFTGELTAKWRKENEVDIDSWKQKNISECCKLGSGGTPSRRNEGYYTGNIPWIKTGEIDWNVVDSSEEKISQEAIENSSAKVYNPGAVLVAMYGMGVTRGKAAILGVKAATNQAVCVLQPQDFLFNRFLFYFFMSNYWKFREQAVGGNQLNLSATIIGKFRINLPSLSEQKEISRILDALVEKELQAKQTAEMVINQIDIMKKSILARAFRGELGTNNPNDENAEELLKRILSEKAAEKENQHKITKKRITIPKEIENLIGTNLEQKIVKQFLENETREVPVEEILSVSSKTFDVLETVRSLERKQLIKKISESVYKFIK